LYATPPESEKISVLAEMGINKAKKQGSFDIFY
jgi:hypothetical protein